MARFRNQVSKGIEEKPETSIQKPEVGKQKLENGEAEPKTKNQKPLRKNHKLVSWCQKRRLSTVRQIWNL